MPDPRYTVVVVRDGDLALSAHPPLLTVTDAPVVAFFETHEAFYTMTPHFEISGDERHAIARKLRELAKIISKAPSSLPEGYDGHGDPIPESEVRDVHSAASPGHDGVGDAD